MSFDIFAGFCPYCNLKFATREDFDAHMIKCEKEEAELYKPINEALKDEPSKVVRLPGAPTPETEAVAKTVEMLEEMLAAAKKGEVRSIAMAWTDQSRKVLRQWHNNGEYMTLVGGVSWLLHDMNHGNRDE